MAACSMTASTRYSPETEEATVLWTTADQGCHLEPEASVNSLLWHVPAFIYQAATPGPVKWSQCASDFLKWSFEAGSKGEQSACVQVVNFSLSFKLSSGLKLHAIGGHF